MTERARGGGGPIYAELFDERLLSEYERDSIEDRLRALRRQLEGVVEASRRLRPPSLGGRPQGAPLGSGLRENPLLALARELIERQGARPGVKAEVVRWVLDGVGRRYLYSNLASLPGFHELSILVPYWGLNQALRAHLDDAAGLLVKEMLHGIVLSLQRVREEILTADQVYLAHCACRSAGISDDLEQGGRVFSLLKEPEERRLLDRLVDRYLELDDDQLNEGTHESFRRILSGLARARDEGSDRYKLSTLLRATWHTWELLPIRAGFTTNWVRSMANNGKCFQIDNELALELVNVFFHARGAVFSSMKCVRSPYTICTCPTPENGGGCILTNWYYFAELNQSLIPADDHYGRLRGPDGRVLPCRYFPVRARRPCIGCGCDHSRLGPRDLDASFDETDRLLRGSR